MWIVNPDLLAARIHGVEGGAYRDANLAAVARIEAWLEASIAVHTTIGVETVLSTGKYRRLVTAAKKLGFLVWLIYVILDSPERSIERIKLRVAKGGHSVPDDDVRRRYSRSLGQFAWFVDQADEVWLFDNSGAKPRQVGRKLDGVVTATDGMPAPLLEALQTIDGGT